MTTYNPFKTNSSNLQTNNSNPFLSVQNKFSSNISNNNPFLSQNNQSYSNINNPFTKINSVNNNKFPSQNNNNPFLSSSFNTNTPFNFNNNNSNGINSTTNFLSTNNNNRNPFLSNNNSTTVNNPFINNNSNQNSNGFNIFNTNYSNNQNGGFLNSNNNNNQNPFTTNTNPFSSILNNNNPSPFSSNYGNNNNNNIFNNYSVNSSINFNQNNNNIFNSTNNFGNNGISVSFGFNNSVNNSMFNNANNNNFIINNSSQNINNNNFFINNSQPFSNLNNNNISETNKSISKKEKETKDSQNKTIPLSKLLSLRFQSEDFLEEFLTKINDDKDNAKLLSKSLNLNNYNDFIIESILSSKSKKDDYIKNEEDDSHYILKQRNMEIKRRREKIINEERYQNYLKNLYKKNEKDEIERLIKLNSQKPNIIINSDKKKKINFNEIKGGDIEIKENQSAKNISKNNIVYKILIKVFNDKKENVLEKNIIVDKNKNYILDLDKLYIDITSTLKILNVNCKYGLNYKINDFEIEKKIRKINLLEYDAENYIKTENNYYKELKMEINIINEENISDEEKLLNPQMHCKNDKNYKLNPSLDIINNSNLFKYDKGLEIIFDKISIVFSNKEVYDLTNINFDELSYDGNYDIFFDETNYKKEKSTFKKLWERNIYLIYKLPELNNTDTLNEFLYKRYSAEFCEVDEGKITLVTKLKNLFLTDKERKNFLFNNK